MRRQEIQDVDLGLPERPPSPGRLSRPSQDRGRSTRDRLPQENGDLPAPPTKAEPAKQKQNDQDDDDEGRC